MFSKMGDLASQVAGGVPGNYRLMKWFEDRGDVEQVQRDLKFLKEIGLVGTRLYVAFNDVRENYLNQLGVAGAFSWTENPYAGMSPEKMLEYLRTANSEYLSYVNKILEVQRLAPLSIQPKD